MKKRRRVLVDLGQYPYKMHFGIARYAREAGWELNMSMILHGFLPKDWDCDGIICFGAKHTSLTDDIRRHQTPFVDLSSFQQGVDWPYIYSDQEAIGIMGADYFLDRGFHHFTYIDGGQRGQAFRKRVKQAGKHFLEIPQNRLEELIDASPKPLALMARNDRIAVTIMESILAMGYAIPHDIAVLGVDDDSFANNLAAIPLSSIDTNAEERGYQAGRLLDHLMDGEEPYPVSIPPRKIITRASTDVLAISDRHVHAGLKIIHEQFAEPGLNLEELASTVGMSRIHLDKKFKSYLGHTMYEELVRIRLKEATRLLRDTDQLAKTVARLSGFSCTDHLSVTIQKYHGMRTRQYKKQLQMQDLNSPGN